MKPPDTFLLTLPSGERVRCWTRQADLIRADVITHGNVLLIRDTTREVYERIDPLSAEGRALAPVAQPVESPADAAGRGE